MKQIIFKFFLFSALVSIEAVAQNTITAELNLKQIQAISPLIYGYNQDHETLNSTSNWSIRRLGGNRLTAFNWENGASNAGSDFSSFANDNRVPSLVGVPSVDKDKAGEAYRFFHQSNLNAGVTSIITFPIQGWVSADKLGSNTTTPPSNRWNQLVFEKGSVFSLTPDLTDGKVYLDEGYNFLLQNFGKSNTASGIKYISLDNEPAFWDDTHPYLQKTPPTIAEYVAKVIAAAKVIKKMDPNVKIILGEFGGINIYDFGDATDWTSLKAGYDWFPSYLLDVLKKESDQFGQALVDYFSFHFYPQHKINVNGEVDTKTGTVVRSSTSTADYIREARMDCPRSLWDTTYIEPSWLTDSKLAGKSNKILHRLQKSIDTYFPGIEIMIGEYDFGFDTDISHAIAMTDFLGMSGQHKLGIATRWDLNTGNGSTYTNSVLRLFRNYDGLNAKYGSRAVASSFNNPKDGAVWASLNDDGSKLHLIVINRDVNDVLNFNIDTKENGYEYVFNACYSIESSSQNLNSIPANQITLSGNKFSGSLPALSTYHIVLNRTPIATGVQNQIDVPSIILSPNPAQKQLQAINLAEGSPYQILNVQGQIINSAIYNGEFIDVGNLQQGMYFFQTKLQTLRFLVE